MGDPSAKIYMGSPATAAASAGNASSVGATAVPGAAAGLQAGPPTFAQVEAIVKNRCQACHNAALAPKRIQLHTPELIEAARAAGKLSKKDEAFLKSLID